MPETFDAAAVRRWCACGLAALERHQSEINQLNVYPIPDGDTGTNLVRTLLSAQQAVESPGTDEPPPKSRPPHAVVLALMARGALLGARGNSGVIVAEMLRGLAESLAGVEVVRGRALSGALRAATTAAYAAVARPVEGTILSVIAAAATAAEGTDSDDLVEVVRTAATAAAEALVRTPEQLPALARAGVVDAGGRGLCVLLDALVSVVAGEPAVAGGPGPVPAPRAAIAVQEAGLVEYAYEVQFLLDAEAAAVAALRASLERLGDSLVVVGTGAQPDGGPTWKVHVHVNDIGAALEAGLAAGRPYQIEVTRFDDQIAAADVSVGRVTAVPAPPAVGPDCDVRGAVVVATGDGLVDLFTAEGAVAVAENPSTGELLDAIRSTGAALVVVLPNNVNTQAVANSAALRAGDFGVRASVVPTRSPVQALAALAVRDPSRRFEDDVIAMAEAAGACRYAEVCYASREALTVAGPCRPGDVLALVEGEVNLVGRDLVGTCQLLLDRMLGGGGELVTLLVGADAPADLAEAVRSHVEQHWPFVEVSCYVGGQPHYPLLVGVE
ncbi:MAG TPA: DAK2 domain-containing protein [Micromonosporaceae bacterium]|nr:DAK2 domain-containing protein [Micromonosporaceae bacterium]